MPPKGSTMLDVGARERLRPGESMEHSQPLLSDNGQFALMLQADGNLVVFSRWPNSPTIIWTSATGDSTTPPRVRAVMTSGGNFVLRANQSIAYQPTDLLVWETGTNGHPDAVLFVRDDGAVVVSENNVILWSTSIEHQAIGLGAPIRLDAMADAPVIAYRNDTVGNGKTMNTTATLYRSGLLVVVSDMHNRNWVSDLRGRILVVGVTGNGQAIWITNPVIEAPTLCSVPDVSCASNRQWFTSNDWPADVAGVITALDIYQGDALDYRNRLNDTLKAICKFGPSMPTVGPTIEQMCQANGM